MTEHSDDLLGNGACPKEEDGEFFCFGKEKFKRHRGIGCRSCGRDIGSVHHAKRAQREVVEQQDRRRRTRLTQLTVYRIGTDHLDGGVSGPDAGERRELPA
ncbi:hypothetical protein D9M70_518090 [compost metagenome]